MTGTLTLDTQYWITTYTGRRAYPLAMRVEDIDILDIAHSLSMQCRYNGHCNGFYSVAEHSVIVSNEVFKRCISLLSPRDAAKMAMAGLLHDAAEAYIGDIVRPLKKQPAFSFIQEIEERLQDVVAERFGLAFGLLYNSPIVKEVDEEMLLFEMTDLFGVEWNDPEYAHFPRPRIDGAVRCHLPHRAKEAFLDRFHVLSKSMLQDIRPTTHPVAEFDGHVFD